MDYFGSTLVDLTHACNKLGVNIFGLPAVVNLIAACDQLTPSIASSVYYNLAIAENLFSFSTDAGHDYLKKVFELNKDDNDIFQALMSSLLGLGKYEEASAFCHASSLSLARRYERLIKNQLGEISDRELRAEVLKDQATLKASPSEKIWNFNTLTYLNLTEKNYDVTVETSEKTFALHEQLYNEDPFEYSLSSAIESQLFAYLLAGKPEKGFEFLEKIKKNYPFEYSVYKKFKPLEATILSKVGKVEEIFGLIEEIKSLKDHVKVVGKVYCSIELDELGRGNHLVALHYINVALEDDPDNMLALVLKKHAKALLVKESTYVEELSSSEEEFDPGFQDYLQEVEGCLDFSKLENCDPQ